MTLIQKLFIVYAVLFPTLVFGDLADSIPLIKIEFSENKGQWPKQVLYKAPLGNGNLWIEQSGLRFDLYDNEALESISHHEHRSLSKQAIPERIKRHVYMLELMNANLESSVRGKAKSHETENYFLGNNPENWASGVSKYQIIEYQSIYEGVNLKIYEKDLLLKWDFIVEPYADPNQILINYQGVEGIRIKQNKLIINTSVNRITELEPIAFQSNENGELIKVECQYILENQVVSFYFPNGYDTSRKLIIDPTLIFASYTGSFADNWGFTATYDSKGFLYAGGIVFGSGYPTKLGAFDSYFNGIFDVSISKFDTTGSHLIYSTYLGGNQGETPTSLIINSNDELILLGSTSSINFPTTASAVDRAFGGGSTITTSSRLTFINGTDLFITHFSKTGRALIGSTFLGGSGNDGIISSKKLINNYADDIRGEVMVDQNDNIYVVSASTSGNFPTTAGVIQPFKGPGEEGIIAKLDNSLSNLIWASFFGGEGDDAIYGIKVDHDQNIYITGGTTSKNLPTTPSCYQSSFQGGTTDGYVAKIGKSGKTILNCTYVGSAGNEQSYLLDLDRYDNVYLFGQTTDTTNTFIYNALWNSPKDGQFISKLEPTLSARIWSTTWGNGAHGIDVVPSAFMVDLCNRVYLSAWGGRVNDSLSGGSTKNLPITLDALQKTTDGNDYYLMVLTDDASALDYGSFYGGAFSDEHVDGGTSRFDNKGRIYQNVCAGCRGNDDFPTTKNCHSSINNSTNCNNGVFKIDFNIPAIVADYVVPETVCLPDTSFFENTSYLSHPNLTSYHWDFGDGNTSTKESPYHIYSQSGIYNVRLIIYDTLSCNLSDTIIQQVVALSGKVDTLETQTICIGNSTQIGILPINDTSVHFLWTPPFFLSDPTISNPFADPPFSTWYTMTMSSSPCADKYHQLVEVINLKAYAGADTSVCDQQVSLVGRGNADNQNYHWSSNNNFTDTLNNYPHDSSVTYLFTQPQYLYFKIDKNDCNSIDSVFIDQKITTSTKYLQNVGCHGDSTGSIFVNVQGATGNISYRWSDGQTSNPATNLAQGKYSLTITDEEGCTRTYDTLITQPEQLTTNTDKRDIMCEDICNGTAWANPSGGTSPYQWQWNDANNQTTNPAVQLCTGIYHVSITDANNCIETDTVIIADSSASIQFKAWVDSDSIYEGTQTQLHSTQLGQGYTYRWQPTESLSDPNISNPIAFPTSSSTYIVEAYDAYGCSWQDTISLYVIDVICEEPYIYVPNAFTPNNDGKNDILYVESSVGYDVDFKIYNRWGELVFETKDIELGWDGRYKGKVLSPGVYVYHLELQCYNSDIFIKKGNITLIR